jgi:hypothetical protein
MPTLSLEGLQAHRAATYRLNRPVTSKDEAVDFVNERGFVFFWPIKGAELPSLWVAVAGDRPVPNEHDDPGHVTWGWKDDLLDKRRWYYAKVLRRKATMISLKLAPYFYALSKNYGDPDADYLQQYMDGTLSREAKLIYEVLLQEGPMHTVALRKATFMGGKKRNYRFNRGLAELQADLKILPVGTVEAGAWRYAYVYDCVHRHFPELPSQARSIGLQEARDTLVRRYFDAVGAAQLRDVRKIFWWPNRRVDTTVEQLMASGVLRGGLTHPRYSGEWLALAEQDALVL